MSSPTVTGPLVTSSYPRDKFPPPTPDASADSSDLSPAMLALLAQLQPNLGGQLADGAGATATSPGGQAAPTSLKGSLQVPLGPDSISKKALDTVLGHPDQPSPGGADAGQDPGGPISPNPDPFITTGGMPSTKSSGATNAAPDPSSPNLGPVITRGGMRATTANSGADAAPSDGASDTDSASDTDTDPASDVDTDATSAAGDTPDVDDAPDSQQFTGDDAPSAMSNWQQNDAVGFNKMLNDAQSGDGNQLVEDTLDALKKGNITKDQATTLISNAQYTANQHGGGVINDQTKSDAQAALGQNVITGGVPAWVHKAAGFLGVIGGAINGGADAADGSTTDLVTAAQSAVQAGTSQAMANLQALDPALAAQYQQQQDAGDGNGMAETLVQAKKEQDQKGGGPFTDADASALLSQNGVYGSGKISDQALSDVGDAYGDAVKATLYGGMTGGDRFITGVGNFLSGAQKALDPVQSLVGAGVNAANGKFNAMMGSLLSVAGQVAAFATIPFGGEGLVAEGAAEGAEVAVEGAEAAAEGGADAAAEGGADAAEEAAPAYEEAAADPPPAYEDPPEDAVDDAPEDAANPEKTFKERVKEGWASTEGARDTAGKWKDRYDTAQQGVNGGQQQNGQPSPLPQLPQLPF